MAETSSEGKDSIGKMTVMVRVHVNRRRVEHVLQRARAVLRRARKRDRPAIAERFARKIAATCIRTSVGTMESKDAAAAKTIACTLGATTHSVMKEKRGICPGCWS